MKLDKLPPLAERLMLVASFVRGGVTVADIGTDHAYVPVYLILSGTCPRAAACDVNAGPLARACATAWEYDAFDKISFIETDGLRDVPPELAEDVVIAGMGGELIARIIASCDFLRDGTRRLVLQPMTAQAELRTFLCQNGFEIIREDVAYEERHDKLYVVMNAQYTGKNHTITPVYAQVGELVRTGGEYARAYIEKQAHTFAKQAEGLKRAKKDVGDAGEKAAAMSRALLDICENMKGADL